MPSIVVNFKTIHSTAKNLTNWVSIWFQRFNYHRSRSFGYRRVPISDLPDRNKIWKIYFISWLIFSISDRLVFMIGLSLLFIKNVKKIELNCYRMFYFSYRSISTYNRNCCTRYGRYNACSFDLKADGHSISVNGPSAEKWTVRMNLHCRPLMRHIPFI